MTKNLLAALAVAALTLTSACGGGADRPSDSEVSKTLQSEDSMLGAALPTKAADCVAKTLVDSELSNDTLQALVDGDEDYEGDKDEEKVLTGLTDDITKCSAA